MSVTETAATETPPKVTTLCLIRWHILVTNIFIIYLLYVLWHLCVSENSYSRWLAVCFCHHYFNAKNAVLLVTELSVKLVSLADWQAFSMSHVTYGSASLILDYSNTEMFLQAKISPCCAFAIKPTSSNTSILCIKPFLMSSNLCAIHSLISTVHVWERSGRVTAPPSKDYMDCMPGFECRII